MNKASMLRSLLQQQQTRPFGTPELRRMTEGVEQFDVLVFLRQKLSSELKEMESQEILDQDSGLTIDQCTGGTNIAYHVAPDFDRARTIVENEQTDLALVEPRPPHASEDVGINLCNILRQARDGEQYYPIVLAEPRERSPQAIRQDLLVSGADAFCYVDDRENFVVDWYLTLQTILRIKFLFQEAFATQAQLDEDRNVDPTTGVYNRRKFQSSAQKIISNFFSDRRMKGEIIMGFFDINNMKAVNDRLGHKKGDEILKDFADVLTEQTRSDKDYIFRWGGDEFIVLFRDLTEEQAEGTCQRIRDAFRAVVGDFEFEISVSWGKSVIESSMEDLNDIIDRCDEKLQRMKDRTSESDRRE